VFEQNHRGCRPRRRPQARAATPCLDEREHGVSHPPFQALQRRLFCSTWRDLLCHRSAEGRNGSLSRFVSKGYVLRAHSVECVSSSDGSNRPYRCSIRAPGFAHLAGADFMMRRECVCFVYDADLTWPCRRMFTAIRRTFFYHTDFSLASHRRCCCYHRYNGEFFLSFPRGAWDLTVVCIGSCVRVCGCDLPDTTDAHKFSPKTAR